MNTCCTCVPYCDGSWVDEAVKPWLSPLEAKLLHDALYDMIYRVLTGDNWAIIKKDDEDKTVANILKGIDLGDENE